MKVSDLIERLKNRNPESEIVCIIWNVDDVIQANASLADDEENLTTDEEITLEECQEVLRLVERYHDAEYGVTWDTLKYHIENVKGRR
jgi:hypothetical protein